MISDSSSSDNTIGVFQNLQWEMKDRQTIIHANPQTAQTTMLALKALGIKCKSQENDIVVNNHECLKLVKGVQYIESTMELCYCKIIYVNVAIAPQLDLAYLPCIHLLNFPSMPVLKCVMISMRPVFLWVTFTIHCQNSSSLYQKTS